MDDAAPVAFGYLVLWGLLATVTMTSILQASQGLGFSRLSLPFLVGTFLTGRRRSAMVVGFVLYTIGGWLFAFFYYFLFESVGLRTWWFGALAGLIHGLFLLVAALPLLPHVHPRMASDYDGPKADHILEPPGFMAMNYGAATPVTALLAQTVYGATLGGFLQLQQAMGLSG